MVAVFFDGCFWLCCPNHGSSPKANADWWRQKLDETVQRDEDTNRRLREAGWTVVRIWEHVPAMEAAALVRETVEHLGAGERGAYHFDAPGRTHTAPASEVRVRTPEA
jgi:DNA mismatch endonuclease (patch repair protein)